MVPEESHILLVVPVLDLEHIKGRVILRDFRTI